MQLLMISGLSGSGKSVAMRALEDLGIYCVDNLPPALLPALVDHLLAAGVARLAVGMDVRSQDSFEDFPAFVRAQQTRGLQVRVLFLDADEEVLVKRFSETRRRHPLTEGDQSLAECLATERRLLEPVRGIAHVLDTSSLGSATLRAWVRQFAGDTGTGLVLLLQSFGFKHGVPRDCDFLFDVRCLPNPHWEPELRPATGRDASVAAWLERAPATAALIDDIGGFLERWLPGFADGQRNYLTVGIGCTGGQHRSVYMVETLARRLRRQRDVLVRHRQLDA